MPAVSPDPLSEPAEAAGGYVTGAVNEASENHVHSPDRSSPDVAPMYDQRTLAEAGELLRALAAPVRIAIVLQLRVSERCVHELVEALGVTQPLISQHLRVLKSAGVVYGQRYGREVVYRLVDEHLAHIVVDAATHAEEISGNRQRLRTSESAAHDAGQAAVNGETTQETETA